MIEHFTYLKSMFAKIIMYFWQKSAISGIATIFFFFFNEAKTDAMLALLFLIFFDFITGIALAKKTGIEIKSAKIFRSALKVAVYFMLVSSGYLTCKAGIEIIPIDSIIIMFLATTELISIIENFGKMGYAIPQKLLNQLEEYKKTA